MKIRHIFLFGALTLFGPAAGYSGLALAQAPGAGTAAPAATPESYPAWAFLWDPSVVVPPATDVPQRLAGSSASFSWAQARDLFVSPDWHPDDHPPMPDIVARGRKPDTRACGSCHRSEGTGSPEGSSLAGLPAAYIVQQIADYKSGARKFSGPTRPSTTIMLATAKAMTDEEAKAAADYFSALKPKRIVKVVESETIPKAYVARLFYAKQPGGGTETLGRRIVEMPDDVDQFELRDSHSQFTAYVPVGSIAKGEALAKASGASAPCASCHGPELKGVGLVPNIAGRSPSYLARQLYEFQQGMRTGSASALMKPTVEKLTQDDIIALAAYVASLNP